MNLIDRIALSISIIAVLVTALVAGNIYENMPHIEDEIAYVWQAETIARGDLTLQTPTVCPNCFLVPFVVDYNGQRFGKYPLGWPVVLSFGIRLGARNLVNPLLAGLCVWFLYRLVKKILDEKTALLAAFLMTISPFFIMNSSTLLAHTWSLFLTIVFANAWIDITQQKNSVPNVILIFTAGLSLGLLALTRPLSAVAVAFPFLVHAGILLFKGNRQLRKSLIAVALITGLVASLHFLWQYALTGNALMNPYQLWWDYDRVGFGPGIGLQEGGYKLSDARANMKFSLHAGYSDLFGWFNLSWIFLPAGLIAIRKNKQAWLISSIFPALLVAYCFYWIGSWLFGPRYYFEGIVSLVTLTAAGMRWSAGKLMDLSKGKFTYRFSRIRFALVSGISLFLILSNLLFYLPARLNSHQGLYGASLARQAVFRSSAAIPYTPALIIVHKIDHWIEYGGLLDLSSPYWDTPFVFTFSRGMELDEQVATLFPDRQVWHYYADTPNLLYKYPRESIP